MRKFDFFLEADELPRQDMYRRISIGSWTFFFVSFFIFFFGMHLNISVQAETKTSFADVATRGLLGKVFRFMKTFAYAGEEERNVRLFKARKFRKILTSHFRKQEINLFGSIIIPDRLLYEPGCCGLFIQTFYYYKIICKYFITRTYWFFPSSFYGSLWGTHSFLGGIVGRIRENRDKRTLRILCQLPLPEEIIVHILTFYFQHVRYVRRNK